MEISQDIFVQITGMGYSILMMGQFITHTLSKEHLLVTSFLQQIQNGNCTQKAIL